MKLENLSSEWKRDILLNKDADPFDKKVREGVLMFVNYKVLQRCVEGEDKSVDHKFLRIVVYSRLKEEGMLPKLKPFRRVEPFIDAVIAHYDTCEAVDTDKAKIKALAKVFLLSDTLRKSQHAEVIATTMLRVANRDNLSQCVDFLALLNPGNELHRSATMLPAILDVAIKKGILAAHSLLLNVQQLMHEMQVEGKSPADKLDLLDRMVAYAKRDDAISPTWRSGRRTPSMLDTIFAADFVLKTESGLSEDDAAKPSEAGMFSPLTSSEEPIDEEREEIEAEKNQVKRIG